MTGASVNFQAVSSSTHAVAHASRTAPPTYLLPDDVSLGSHVVRDDRPKMETGEYDNSKSVAAILKKKMAMASRQARQDKRYSAVWEGVLNLPRPDLTDPLFDKKAYIEKCNRLTKDWIKAYEEKTGHTVLRADVHLDEGRIDKDTSEILLNAHAHVIADRTNDKGKCIILSPKMMVELQDMTAEVIGLERGKPARETKLKHISSQQYKWLAARGQLITQQKVTDIISTKDQLIEFEREEKARYKAEREEAIASKTATKEDYKKMKAAHEKILADKEKELQQKDIKISELNINLRSMDEKNDSLKNTNDVLKFTVDKQEKKLQQQQLQAAPAPTYAAPARTAPAPAKPLTFVERIKAGFSKPAPVPVTPPSTPAPAPAGAPAAATPTTAPGAAGAPVAAPATKPPRVYESAIDRIEREGKEKAAIPLTPEQEEKRKRSAAFVANGGHVQQVHDAIAKRDTTTYTRDRQK